MTIITTTVGKILRKNGVAIIVNKRVRNALLGCNLKNNRMISVRFQGKSFNIASVLCFGFSWLRGLWDLNSPTGDQTHTPAVKVQSLNHWTTREALTFNY